MNTSRTQLVDRGSPDTGLQCQRLLFGCVCVHACVLLVLGHQEICLLLVKQSFLTMLCLFFSGIPNYDYQKGKITFIRTSRQAVTDGVSISCECMCNRRRPASCLQHFFPQSLFSRPCSSMSFPIPSSSTTMCKPFINYLALHSADVQSFNCNSRHGIAAIFVLKMP